MVPKLRLSLFKDDKSSRWSLAKLGEIVEFKKGKGISKSDISKNGVYPCVRYGELYTITTKRLIKFYQKQTVPLMNMLSVNLEISLSQHLVRMRSISLELVLY